MSMSEEQVLGRWCALGWLRFRIKEVLDKPLLLRVRGIIFGRREIYVRIIARPEFIRVS